MNNNWKVSLDKYLTSTPPDDGFDNWAEQVIGNKISFEFYERNEDWGYGGVYMMNLFAIVSSNPDILLTNVDLLGANNEWLDKISKRCEHILFAWGNFKQAEYRAKEVINMFPNAICLGLNKNGSPKHPLYVSANTNQINYK